MKPKEYKSAAKRYGKLLALLCGNACAKYSRLDYARWGADCGMSESTLRRRIQTPQDITLGELRDMARPFEIETEAIHAALPL